MHSTRRKSRANHERPRQNQQSKCHWVTNPRLDPADRPTHSAGEVPAGDDPVSGCVALVMLPVLLVGLVRQLGADRRFRAGLKTAPPLDPPHTVVTITTCARHRYYGWRFVGAGVVGSLVLATGWATWMLLDRDELGAPLWLIVSTLVGTVAFPMVLLMVWGMHGPVRVSRVGRDAVTLTGVREAYFNTPDPA